MLTKNAGQNQVTQERLMQFGFAYALPLIIDAAINNKVFDMLAAGPKTVEEVSSSSRRSPKAID